MRREINATRARHQEKQGRVLQPVRSIYLITAVVAFLNACSASNRSTVHLQGNLSQAHFIEGSDGQQDT
jgi:hypothetical protein